MPSFNDAHVLSVALDSVGEQISSLENLLQILRLQFCSLALLTPPDRQTQEAIPQICSALFAELLTLTTRVIDHQGINDALQFLGFNQMIQYLVWARTTVKPQLTWGLEHGTDCSEYYPPEQLAFDFLERKPAAFAERAA